MFDSLYVSVSGRERGRDCTLCLDRCSKYSGNIWERRYLLFYLNASFIHSFIHLLVVVKETPPLCKALWVPRKALYNVTNYYYYLNIACLHQVLPTQSEMQSQIIKGWNEFPFMGELASHGNFCTVLFFPSWCYVRSGGLKNKVKTTAWRGNPYFSK